MPQINIDKIVTFNSEDPVHVASNLLDNNPSKKWKCKNAGDKTATIVLQLDQPHVITGIDIGNEHSAYIEVLVCRSSNAENYKVLLVMSSFMTPLESRQSQNINKVRMFKQEDFSEPERNEKWDRLKIVCTQPFNRHVQYGLSFINFYSNSGGKAEPKKQTMGKFLIRPESPDNISAGSLFFKQKEIKDDTLRGAAAIREASTAAHSGSPVVKEKIKINGPSKDYQNRMDSPKPRNRDELLYSKDEEDINEKIDKVVQKKAKEKAELEDEQKRKNEETIRKKEQHKKTKESEDVDKKPLKNNTPNKKRSKEKEEIQIKQRNVETKTKNNETQKRKSSEDTPQRKKKLKLQKQRKPFARLLEGVVLVISGIQNPDRASLRTMALSMGAKYKPDWDNSCTHLICAFANTPKFNQVKGRGKIVKRKWIEDCYNEKKRLPWRRYALDKADNGPESEEEIWEEEEHQFPPSDDERIVEPSDAEDETKESGYDVEDKIREIQQKQQRNDNSNDIYDRSTDSEPEREECNGDLEIKNKLENIFDNKIFYIDDVFEEDLRRKLKQYIVAYNGLINDTVDNTVDIMITNETNAKFLKDMYPSSVCASPDWIWECHNTKTLAPMDDFVYQ
ncbi:DNA repair protein XRCC1 [Sitophilus oryzae]|uniref:DNA repair protein XRCC1 n=1 Tax=Sitophilus oryzae TaxID=7048 RepID=A0A6J2YKH2_SITOR|nr:DNA repair protein XRCC1 [Sitophilus oryzae]